MAAVTPAPQRFRLRVEAVRDVCARPAFLLALAEGIPPGAVRGAADRRRAVADGVARALALAERIEGGNGPDRHDRTLLEEAHARLWEPADGDLARVLRSAGPDGLLAALVLQGAARREAWRADAERRRERSELALDPGLADPDERDPVDLSAFRVDVERAALRAARRTGLAPTVAAGLVAREVTYAEAARATGRSSNALWMALARLRPEWRELARRGREAGLGGGVLVDAADRLDRGARRVVRWRLVGGLAAALVLATTAGALAGATLLTGTAPPPRAAEPPAEAIADDGAFGHARRLARLEALRRLAPAAPAAVERAPRARRGDRAAKAEVAAAPSTTPLEGAVDASEADAAPEASPSCGLGTADLACR